MGSKKDTHTGLPSTAPVRKQDSKAIENARAMAARESRKTQKNLALGFVMGMMVMSTLFTMRDADVQTWNHAYVPDHAAGVLPPNLPKCDDQGLTVVVTPNENDNKHSGERQMGNPGRADELLDDDGTEDIANIYANKGGYLDANGNRKEYNAKEGSGSEVHLKDQMLRVYSQAKQSAGEIEQKAPPLEAKEQKTDLAKKVPAEVATDDANGDDTKKKAPKEHIGEYIPGMGVKDFDPDVPAVIVTKIHGSETAAALEQSICLLTKAYNDRVRYDIIVFTSVPWPEEAMAPIQKVAEPANLQFVVDNPGLQEMVDALEPGKKEFLLNRCNATNSSTLTWYSRCYEKTSDHWSNERIAYNWQAEFRAKHLWNHPSLTKYKYMLWLDSDAYCSKVWKQDPIAAMVRHDLVILFDHFPQGWAKGQEWPARFQEAFGKVICSVKLRNGTLTAAEGGCLGKNARIRQLHGYFHVTNLEFYRSAPVTNWFNVMIGNTTFSRFYDDQIGVTMPAAVLAGNRSWDMYYHGIKLDVVHNYLIDGRPWQPVGGFKGYWFGKNGSSIFPEAAGVCSVTVGG